MQEVDLNNVMARLLDLIESALEREEVVITRANQPILKLVRVSMPKIRRQRGSAKGLITIADDFDKPLEDFDA